MSKWYISNSGNDNNDGLQADTPKRTLGNLFKSIEDAKDNQPCIFFHATSVWNEKLDIISIGLGFTGEQLKRISDLGYTGFTDE